MSEIKELKRGLDNLMQICGQSDCGYLDEIVDTRGDVLSLTSEANSSSDLMEDTRVLAESIIARFGNKTKNKTENLTWLKIAIEKFRNHIQKCLSRAELRNFEGEKEIE